MKTTIKLLTLAALIAGGSSQMQAQTMKEKLAAKKAALEAKMSKAGSKYKTYDYEDPTGLSGTYFINTQLVGKNNTIGLKFEKEKDGNIVNELLVSYGKESSTYDADEFESTARLDEKIQKEFDFKVFKVIKSDIFEWRSKDVSFCELTEHVFAVVLEGSVISVAAKDSSLFADYDIETAQVLIDQKNGQLKAEEIKKEKEKWMKNDVYAKYHGKLTFSPKDWMLMERGMINKPPTIKEEAFSTSIEPQAGMQFNIYFDATPAIAYPGQEIDIVYTIGGKSYSRVDLRAESAKGSKWIKRLETKDFRYLQSGPRGMFYFNDYQGRTVMDYAFASCMLANKALFVEKANVPVTIQVYLSKDGERGELLSEGTLSLSYTADARSACEKTGGMWDQMEEVVND